MQHLLHFFRYYLVLRAVRDIMLIPIEPALLIAGHVLTYNVEIECPGLRGCGDIMELP